MPENEDFINYIIDMLQDFGEVDARYMFGDWGLYNDGLFFAIVSGGKLFVKADDQNRQIFEQNNLEQFSYMKQGKRCFLNYYAVPEEVIDDMDALKHWADMGYQAALRASNKS